MKKLNLILLLSVLATNAAQSQGTLVFDQESSTDEAYPVGGPRIQFYGSVGQSFTPSLGTVGFVRLKLDDVAPGNFLGATLVVNLRSNAINGPLMGTTTPVVLADGFAGSVNFFFASAVAVVPNTTYFFQTIVQSGDNWGITVRQDSFGDVNYSGGVFYGGLGAFTGADLWFREGIVVPEPTSVSLLLIGVCWAGLSARRRH
jgi:hypothetical protein